MASVKTSSLRSRLVRSILLIVGLMIVMAIVSGLSFMRLGSAIQIILEENHAAILACVSMSEALELQEDAALNGVLPDQRFNETAFRNAAQAFEDALNREEQSAPLPGEREYVAKIRALYAKYLLAINRLVGQDEAVRSTVYLTEIKPLFLGIKECLQHIIALNQAQMQRADAETQSMARTTTRLVLIISVAALGFAAWVAWKLPRDIMQPVEDLIQGVQAIENDEPKLSGPIPDIDELQTLARHINRMFVIIRTRREKTLAELQQALDFAQSTVECMLDPVAVFNRSGDILLANQAATATFGLHRGTLDSLMAEGIIVPDEIVDAYKRVFATSKPVLPQSFSQAVRTKHDATGRYYLIRAWPLQTEPGELQRAIVVAHDVTRFRHIDALKSDMVATVSHEFKTPLTSLTMGIYLLLDPTSGPLNDMQREVVTSLRTDTERLRAMVDELLDLVRIEAAAGGTRRKQLSPVTLLKEVAEAHRSLAESKMISFAITADDSVGSISVVPEHIAIVLANLVSNAIRHTQPGGVITLQSRGGTQAVELIVTDSGEGMEPARLAELLDAPLLSVSSSGDHNSLHKRHGLGLAIARSIVKQHGGELRVQSTPGIGSSFILSLPAEQQDAISGEAYPLLSSFRAP